MEQKTRNIFLNWRRFESQTMDWRTVEQANHCAHPVKVTNSFSLQMKKKNQKKNRHLYRLKVQSFFRWERFAMSPTNYWETELWYWRIAVGLYKCWQKNWAKANLTFAPHVTDVRDRKPSNAADAAEKGLGALRRTAADCFRTALYNYANVGDVCIGYIWCLQIYLT